MPYRTEPPELQVDRDIVREPEPPKPSSEELFARAQQLAASRRNAHAKWQEAHKAAQGWKQRHDDAERDLVATVAALDAALREGR